jgi:hypothetical protein
MSLDCARGLRRTLGIWLRASPHSRPVSRGADVVQRGDLTPSRGRGASGYSDIAGVAGRRPTVLVKAVLKSLAEA